MPIYMVADDMGSLGKDLDSCMCPAWAARGVSDTVPTCTLLWDPVTVELPESLRDRLGYTTGVQLLLPYLAPNNNVIQSMVERAAKAGQTTTTNDVEVVELTRASTPAVRQGGRGSGGSKKAITLPREYFGSNGISRHFARKIEEEGQGEGEPEKQDRISPYCNYCIFTQPEK